MRYLKSPTFALGVILLTSSVIALLHHETAPKAESARANRCRCLIAPMSGLERRRAQSIADVRPSRVLLGRDSLQGGTRVTAGGSEKVLAIYLELTE